VHFLERRRKEGLPIDVAGHYFAGPLDGNEVYIRYARESEHSAQIRRLQLWATRNKPSRRCKKGCRSGKVT